MNMNNIIIPEVLKVSKLNCLILFCCYELREGLKDNKHLCFGIVDGYAITHTGINGSLNYAIKCFKKLKTDIYYKECSSYILLKHKVYYNYHLLYTKKYKNIEELINDNIEELL